MENLFSLHYEFLVEIMNTSQQPRNSPDENVSRIGLMANGRAGGWDVSVDETTSGPDKWFLQIEGPSVYLYFEIASLGAISALLKFLESPEALPTERPGKIEVGTFNEIPVVLLRDDEFPDRYFFCVGREGRATLRISVVGDSLLALPTAIRQVADGLKSEGK